MKRKILKTIFSVALIGALSFSGVVTSWTGMTTVEAAKINQQQKTLGQVSGISYDAKNQRLVWNSVPGASRYQVTITDAEGYEYNGDSYSLYLNLENISLSKYGDYYYYYDYKDITDGTYTVSITAQDTSSYNIVADGIKYSDRADYDYDKSVAINPDADYSERIYTLYAYPTGTPGTATFTYVAEKTNTTGVTAIPYITQKEVNEDYVVFKTPDELALFKGEYVRWEYSNNAEFKDDNVNNFKRTTIGDELEVPLNYYLSGETMYVRARVYNPYYQDGAYSAYSPVLSYTVPKAVIQSVVTRVTANSITMYPSLKSGSANGFQFAKKVGSKWVTLDTQTSMTYTDSGLNKNTKYQYRVRTYEYNPITKKTVWSAWFTVDATTWGANMNLKADVTKSTSVKLTWKPVAEAEGYEIYRFDTSSTAMNYEKGIGLENFSSNTLVKTLSGAKKKTYTDKNLTKGLPYTYVVRAYRTLNKQKVYIDSSVTVSLKAGSLSNIQSYVNAKGKTVVTWSRMTGIKGYYLEKYDPVTQDYVRIKTLKASAKSYTFNKVNVGSDQEVYRIRPFDKNMIYDSTTVTIVPTLASVTGVKAVKTANGVQISWKPVAGADYYRVYRTTDSDYMYNKTRKTYTYYGGETVYEGAVNTTSYRPELNPDDDPYAYPGTYFTKEIEGTSVLDTAITYKVASTDENGQPIKIGTTVDGDSVYQTEDAFFENIQGPEPGVKYYYYVVAHAKAQNGSYDLGKIESAGDSKAVEVVYTNAVAKKVSKITSLKSSKKGQVTVKFKKVSGVNGYAIYRSTKKNGTYSLVGTSTKTTFTDKSATSGKTYYYKVASYVKGEMNANIYSAKTAAKKVKVK